jgi:hypothetical protein
MLRLCRVVMLRVWNVVLSSMVTGTGRVARAVVVRCHTGRKLRGIARSRSVFGVYGVSAWLRVGIVLGWWTTMSCLAKRSFLTGVFVRRRMDVRMRLVSGVAGSSGVRYRS